MARSARRPAAEARDHVLAVVEELFYWHGIRATGVDIVATEAGIAPTTLYRLFASKDELVATYVDRAAQGYRCRFEAVLAEAGPSPRAQIFAVFDALIKETDPELCRGCPFQLVLGETPDQDSAARQSAVELKSWVREQFGALTAALPDPAPDAEALADDLMLILEGVYASMGSAPEQAPARHARDLVGRLLPPAPQSGATRSGADVGSA